MTGYELKEKRDALKMTQEQLSRALDVTLSTVARWEQLKDEHLPNSRLLELALDSLSSESKKKKGGK